MLLDDKGHDLGLSHIASVNNDTALQTIVPMASLAQFSLLRMDFLRIMQAVSQECQ